MKIKTCELTGSALNWAVAKCEGTEFEVLNQQVYIPDEDGVDEPYLYRPSENYDDGGPIIEREGITMEYTVDPDKWCANIMADQEVYGSTLLIAAMRCYVASQLGDEVNVPDEFMKGKIK